MERGQQQHDKRRMSAISSFRDIPYKSEEMKGLLTLDKPEVITTKTTNEIKYNANQIFPDWILGDGEWKKTTGKNTDNTLSDILKTPPHQRTQEQVSTLIHWLMGVWEIANTMGFKRCGQMLQAFKYFEYAPGENIIVEGERGLTFYIIISGETSVHKGGIGVVATLGQGKSFGEIALTQGKDLRTASIRALTRVEVLQLHKLDYDTFVKDIQLSERRENFHLLRECPLFKEWARAKVERMANACNRMVFNAGQTIFKQGDEPDNLYLVFEGSVRIIKNVHIVNKNRWPVGPHDWAEISKRITKPFLIQTLTKGGYFGELSIMKQTNRSTTAEAATRCTLIALDKLEFLHLLNHSKPIDVSEEILMDQEQDNVLLQQQMDVIKGGPSSVAMMMHSTENGEGGGTTTMEARKKSSKRAKTPRAGNVCTALLNLQREHGKHVKIAEDRLKKLAQDRMFAKNPHLAAQNAKQAAKAAAAKAPPSRATTGLLQTMVMSGNFGQMQGNAPETPTSKAKEEPLSTPKEPKGHGSAVKAKAKMLSTHEYDLKDRIDIILCSATPPPNAPLVPDKQFHHFDEKDGLRSKGRSSIRITNADNEWSPGSDGGKPEVPEESSNPTNSSAAEMPVLDTLDGEDQPQTSPGSGKKIPLPELRELWRNVASANMAERRLCFNSYDKPEPNPLRIKPLMYNMEHANFYHTSSAVQLPTEDAQRRASVSAAGNYDARMSPSGMHQQQLTFEDVDLSDQQLASYSQSGNGASPPKSADPYQYAAAAAAAAAGEYDGSFDGTQTRSKSIAVEKGRGLSRVFGKNDNDMNVALQKMKDDNEKTRKETTKATSFIISTKSPLDNPGSSPTAAKHRQKHKVGKRQPGDESGTRPVQEDDGSAETGTTSASGTSVYESSVDIPGEKLYPTSARSGEDTATNLTLERKLHHIDIETQKQREEDEENNIDGSDSGYVSVDQDIYDENAATALAVLRANNTGGYDYNSAVTDNSGGVYSSAYSAGPNASLKGGILGAFPARVGNSRGSLAGKTSSRLTAPSRGRGKEEPADGRKVTISKLRENLASKGKVSYKQVMGL